MATVTFASMVPAISAFLPGCPSLTIERTARKMAIDLCQRAKVWRDDMAPIATVAGQEDYVPAPAFVHGEFCDFLSGYTIDADGTRQDLAWKPYDNVQRAFPTWPVDTDGTPQYITSKIPGTVLLAPVPDFVGTLNIYGVLRPTPSATVWDAAMYAEFHRVIFHGVLFELLGMHDRSWTNPKLSMFHGQEWTFLLSGAKDRADRGFNVSDLVVQPRPFA